MTASTNNLQPTTYNPALHRFALLTAILTLPLIFLGGLVTSNHAGMSVPDWPNTYGYNLFFFPFNRWIGGIFYEHTHRLLASAVGFSSMVLTFYAWGPSRTQQGKNTVVIVFVISALVLGSMLAVNAWTGGANAGILTTKIVQLLTVLSAIALFSAVIAFFCRSPDARPWVRLLCTGVLGMVIIQGILGGLRVVLVKLDLAIVHACVAQAFFCLATLAAIVTSKWWQRVPDLSHTADAPLHRRLIIIAVATVLIIYTQLMIGATMRHFNAGLAIPDLPRAYGHWLPPITEGELNAANNIRIWQLNLEPVTLQQIWLHFAHRMGAIAVTLCILLIVYQILRHHRSRMDLILPAWILSVLLIIQIGLGILTVYMRKPADIASTHVAVGALVLVSAFIIAVRAIRLYSLRFRSESPEREAFSQRHGGLHTVPG